MQNGQIRRFSVDANSTKIPIRTKTPNLNKFSKLTLMCLSKTVAKEQFSWIETTKISQKLQK